MGSSYRLDRRRSAGQCESRALNPADAARLAELATQLESGQVSDEGQVAADLGKMLDGITDFQSPNFNPLRAVVDSPAVTSTAF